MDDDLTNRRGLLRQFVARVADGAKELVVAENVLRSVVAEPGPRLPDLEPETPLPPLPPAQLPDGAIAIDEILELATEHGLAARLEDVRRLCRASARLAPADAELRSHAGGGSARPEDVEVPLWQGEPLPLVARIDLAEAAMAADLGVLPPDGTLWVFCHREAARARRSDPDSGACRVLFEASRRARDPDARPLAMAGELALPRVWSERVAALALSADEQAGWEALRLQVAAAQGVEPFDAGPRRPIHRLLGWPDERSGSMPLACAMLAAGVDLDGEHPPAGPSMPELAAASTRWRLLIQLSVDPALDPGWRGEGDRLYVWVDEDALATRDFSGAQAFVH